MFSDREQYPFLVNLNHYVRRHFHIRSFLHEKFFHNLRRKKFLLEHTTHIQSRQGENEYLRLTKTIANQEEVVAWKDDSWKVLKLKRFHICQSFTKGENRQNLKEITFSNFHKGGNRQILKGFQIFQFFWPRTGPVGSGTWFPATLGYLEVCSTHMDPSGVKNEFPGPVPPTSFKVCLNFAGMTSRLSENPYFQDSTET